MVADDGRELEVYDETLYQESLEEISKEFPNQEITDAKLDELEAVEDFQSVENEGKFRISFGRKVIKLKHDTEMQR